MARRMACGATHQNLEVFGVLDARSGVPGMPPLSLGRHGAIAALRGPDGLFLRQHNGGAHCGAR
jgi:hypothetical protein